MNKQNTYTGIPFRSKKLGNLAHSTAQMNPEYIILSEISQLQKEKYFMISHT